MTAAAEQKKVGRGLPAVLEQSQVAHYLLALGLVNPRSVLDEELVVTDVSRRNTVFVAATPEATLVVKQAGPAAPETLAHEAAVLARLAPLRLAPEVVHYDPGALRLVLRSPAGAVAWGEQRRIPRLAAGALGRALATVHVVRPAQEAPAAVDRLWVLSLAEPPLARLRDLSAGAVELVALVQGSRDLCDRLRRLREAVRADAFVHGDLRWDNCLAVPAPGTRRRTRVLLIDWELAGSGDAAADVGAALGEYLRLWATDPGHAVGRPRHGLERLQPAMRALWAGYRRGGGPPVALRRVVELAAARVLQAALERAQGLVRPSREASTLLQLADNLLRTPDDAARRVLGLRE